MLLGRSEVHSETTDESGQTPFSWATGSGHEEPADSASGKKNVDTLDEISQTSFLLAAMLGHDEIACMLPGWNNVNINTTDESG